MQRLPKFSSNANGSATFAGDVQAGGNAEDAARPAGAVLRSVGSLTVSRASGSVFAGYEAGTNLETSTITADGSATFAEYDAAAVPSTNGIKLDAPNGRILISQEGSGNTAADNFLRCKNTVDGQVITLFTDGSATFEGNGIFRGTLSIPGASGNGLYVGDSAATGIILAKDGSATFAGDVNQGESWNRAVDQRSVLITGGAVYAQRNSTDGSNPVFRGTLSTTDSSDAAITSQINADGSAEFASTITAGGYSFANLQEL